MPGPFDDFLHPITPSRRGQYIMSQLQGTKRPRYPLSDDERRVLLVLYRFLDIRGDRAARLLTAYFNTPEDKFSGRLCSTYHCVSRSNKHPVWREVYEDANLQQPPEMIKRIIDRVRGIIQSLRISPSRANANASAVTPARIEPRTQSSDLVVVHPSQKSQSTNDSTKQKVIEISDDETERATANSHFSKSSAYPTPLSDTTSTPLGSFREVSEALPDTPCPPYRAYGLASSAGASSSPVVKQSCETTSTPPTLLFRSYDHRSAGVNSDHGFRAAFFNITTDPIPELPSDTDFFLQSAGKHLRGDLFQSPFISVTPSLVWAVHRAISSQDSSIAVVNTPDLPSKHVWHAAPLLSRIRGISHEHVSFWPSSRKHKKYRAAAEYLVYGQISRASMAGTITLAAIYELAKKYKSAARILRLDIMNSHTAMWSLREAFILKPVMLDDDTQIGFAQILLLYGIAPSITAACIEAGVYALTQGWALFVDGAESAIDAEEPAIIEEFFGEWVYYYCKKTSNAAAIDMPATRGAFAQGILRAQKDLCRARKRLSQVKSPRRSRVLASGDIEDEDGWLVLDDAGRDADEEYSDD